MLIREYAPISEMRLITCEYGTSVLSPQYILKGYWPDISLVLIFLFDVGFRVVQKL